MIRSSAADKKKPLRSVYEITRIEREGRGNCLLEAVIAPGVNSLPFAQAVLIPDSFMWLLYELERDPRTGTAIKISNADPLYEHSKVMYKRSQC